MAALPTRSGAVPWVRGPRRNVILEPGSRGSGAPASVDILRQVVTRRWNPETQFLDLEVSHLFHRLLNQIVY